MSETNVISSAAPDRKYFTMIPRIVLALCEDPYEVNLWLVIKEIAGEDGECYISTLKLALLANQSVGALHARRASLLKKGLIRGRKIKISGTDKEVWHLRIPDLWPANMEWATKHVSIEERLEFKRRQKQGDLSPDEATILHKNGHHSPGERYASPGESKKNPLRRTLEVKEKNEFSEKDKKEVSEEQFEKAIQKHKEDEEKTTEFARLNHLITETQMRLDGRL